jgi:hypothetical protein
MNVYIASALVLLLVDPLLSVVVLLLTPYILPEELPYFLVSAVIFRVVSMFLWR